MKPRFIYFILFFWLSSPGKFKSLLLSERGLNGYEISIILSLTSFISLFSPSVVSYSADRLGHALVLGFTVCFATAFFCLQYLPEVSSGMFPKSFGYFAVLAVLYSTLTASVHPIMSGLVAKHATRDKTISFGSERLYGSAAYGIAHVTYGFILDKYESGVIYFISIFLAFLFLIVLNAYCSSDPAVKPVSIDEKDVTSSIAECAPQCCSTVVDETEESSDFVKIITVLKIIFSSSASTSLLMLAATLACGGNILHNLGIIFFRNTLGTSNTVLGLSIFVSMICEMSMFGFSDYLLKNFGKEGLFLIAGLSYVVRTLLYTVIKEGWLVICLEIFHGITYACKTTAINAYVDEIAPPDMNATTRSIFTTANSIIGIFGTTICGYINDAYGPLLLYKGMAITMLIVSLTYFVSAKLELQAKAEIEKQK